MSPTTPQTVDQLQDEGKALYRASKFAPAIEKYTEAIELDGENASLYVGRAAAYGKIKRYRSVIKDCQKCLDIDPHNLKAWFKKAEAHEHLTEYSESLRGYRRAIRLAVNDFAFQTVLEDKVKEVLSKVNNVWTPPLNLLIALAKAHDIPTPTDPSAIDTPDKIHGWRDKFSRHPKWGTAPLVRALLIPEDDSRPIRPIEIPVRSDAQFAQDVGRILGCKYYDTEVLYSQDDDLWYNRRDTNPYGAYIGEVYFQYEAYMDDSALAARSPNKRASELLLRPGMHGPILVVKVVRYKSHEDRVGRTSDNIGWERITTDDLRKDLTEERRKVQLELLKEQWRGRGFDMDGGSA